MYSTGGRGISGGGACGLAGGDWALLDSGRPGPCPLTRGLAALASSAAYWALRRAFSSAAVMILPDEVGGAGVGLCVREVAEGVRVAEDVLRGGGVGGEVLPEDRPLGGG
jgi:hypothetical protein